MFEKNINNLFCSTGMHTSCEETAGLSGPSSAAIFLTRIYDDLLLRCCTVASISIEIDSKSNYE